MGRSPLFTTLPARTVGATIDERRTHRQTAFPGAQSASLEGAETLSRQAAERLLGRSEPMIELRRRIDLVAPQDSTVLLLGESGSGKELVAEALHRGSSRCDGPFVKVNCAAIPESLLEAELFGHEAGAFTGALHARKGRFALADGGTIFLDEIGEMPRAVQASLLRVLQEHEFTPLGSEETLRSDFRLLCATNRDLANAVRNGDFQADLFYRIHVVVLDVPPLRERGDDLTLLAEHFLAITCERYGREMPSLDESAREVLAAHAWPGNVRELQNAMERVLVTSEGGELTARDFAFLGPKGELAPTALLHQLLRGELSLEAFELAIIECLLREEDGNAARAAKRLGLTPRQLKYRLEKRSE
ncbi:MAG: sigma-54 dependent transcriptional regulator [Planctomycetota bacterium]